MKTTPIQLIHQGLLVASIVLRNDATPTEEFAAQELRRYLTCIAGTKPCLRDGMTAIHLNDHRAAETAGIDVAALQLGPEDFHIQVHGPALHILGGGDRGALYATYALLERLGCRWFAPDVERIPTARDVVMKPFVLTARPAFNYREQFYWETKDPLWRVRNRLNGSMHLTTPGIPSYMGGNARYGMWAHTFFPVVSPDEFFASRPEYFGMIAGMRRRDANQFCLTNPHLPALFAQRLLQRMRKDPTATIWSVSQTDGHGYCECPACNAMARAEGARSGPLLHFVNLVAALVAREFPKAWIDTLAYQWTVDAPRHIRPAPNVRVRLCSFACCQAHPFGTCGHAESGRFLRALKGWSKIAAGQFDVWHYSTNFGHYLLPMPDFDELEGNFSLFQRLGVRGIFAQGQGDEGGGAELSNLRGYVISRLLWDPSQPVWPLVDDFLPAYYGHAAGAVRRYLNLFHAAVRKDRNLHVSLGESPLSALYAPARMRTADALLEAGEQTVQGIQRQRVRLLRSGLGYARLSRAVQGFRIEGSRYHNDAAPADRRLLRQLVADWQRAGVNCVSESSPMKDRLPLWRNRLSSHRILWLRQGGVAVGVVPSLGGRLLEIHAAGRQWLTPADPQAFDYPCPEGYSEVAGYVVGSVEPYACRRTGGTLHLSATAGNGLKMGRRISLRRGVLHIESRLWNPGTSTADCSWGAGFRLQPQGLQALRIHHAGGVETIPADKIPSDATLAFEGERVPAHGWELDFGSDGRLVHTFGGNELYRAAVGRSAIRPGLSLYLCTNLLRLKPGQGIRMWQELSLRT